MCLEPGGRLGCEARRLSDHRRCLQDAGSQQHRSMIRCPKHGSRSICRGCLYSCQAADSCALRRESSWHPVCSTNSLKVGSTRLESFVNPHSAVAQLSLADILRTLINGSKSDSTPPSFQLHQHPRRIPHNQIEPTPLRKHLRKRQLPVMEPHPLGDRGGQGQAGVF